MEAGQANLELQEEERQAKDECLASLAVNWSWRLGFWSWFFCLSIGVSRPRQLLYSRNW